MLFPQRSPLLAAAFSVFALLFCADTARAQDTSSTPATGGSFVSTDVGYSSDMFDRQDNVTNKIALALRARQQGTLATNKIYLGGRFFGSVINETTNSPGNFPILSRLPPSHASGSSDTYGVINEISLNATATLPWVTAFLQGEHTEVAYPGQDDTQLRKYWVAIGDLSQFPAYLAVGRKTVNFGNFASYAPFTHTHSAHYFWAQSEDPLVEAGYVTDTTELTFSLIPAHRGFRVLSSPQNNGAYENYALNASHRFTLNNDLALRVGAGYLRGTIYDSAIAHHPPSVGVNRKWNGAYNVNVTLSGRNFDVMAEFTETEKAWPATGHKVSAITLQGRYRSQLFGKPVTYSLAASRGTQGPSGTAWARMDQVVLGLEMDVHPNMQIGLEYLYNEGFVPLIMPTVSAVKGVKSDTVIVGAKLTF